MLTPAQVQEFQDKGFLALPGFASAEEVATLQQAGRALLDAFDPSTVSVFSTRDQAKKTDAYFLDSASRVSFFFEEGAFDAAGALTVPKALAVNKIGHAMHDLDPVFRAWTRDNPKLAALLRALGYRRPLPVQSMFITKQPGIGGEVVPHQDSTFLRTEPPSVTGLWLALEDATLDNGCLWALPGSHKAGVYRRFCRAADGSVAFGGELPAFDEAAFEPVEVKAGTLVLLHGANLHMSKENRSGASRHAFTVHYVEGAPGTTYAPENWLQREPGLPFEPLYDDAAAA